MREPLLLHLVFTLFEIYQISSHKIEAQRFIFHPTKEAPTLPPPRFSGAFWVSASTFRPPAFIW